MEAIVLLYNMTKERENTIRTLCEKLSVRAVSVPKNRHGCTIGQALRGEGADRSARHRQKAGPAHPAGNEG